MKDVIVVGGGLAGLSAAWRLRNWDVQILESSHRVGGRIRSEARGKYFLNWGGHVFAGEASNTERLFQETGTRWATIPGSLAALSMNGKLLKKGPVPTYPFRIPMPMASRLELLKVGAKVSKDVLRYALAVRTHPGESGEARQQRIYDFENERTFADYTGPLSEDADALFRPTVTRSAGDSEEISAGAGIGYFSLVWNIGQGLNRSILGGPSTLTETMAAGMRDRITTGAEVHEVIHRDNHVVVRYRDAHGEHEDTARAVVVATPATVTHRVAVDLPADQRDALGAIQYGSYVSAAFLTNETTEQVWDDVYGIATPKRSFNVLLNMGNVQRGMETRREPGGSLMVFSPASLANRLLERTDQEIRETYVRDLDQVLPGVAEHIQETHIQRWHTGAPYCFPGRGKLQPTLLRQESRVFLAGDYMGTLYTESAITSGFTAAQRVATQLATQRQVLGAPHSSGGHHGTVFTSSSDAPAPSLT